MTFVNAERLAAAEVATVNVALTPPGGRPASLAMRLISSGHFVADTTLPRPGVYRLRVQPGGGAATTLTFHLEKSRASRA